MKEMGWSYADLVATPFVMLEEIQMRLEFRDRWNRIKQQNDKQEQATFGAK